MNILVADLETDGLLDDVTTIWMVGILDHTTDEFTAYVGDDVAEGLMRLQAADLIIGHNWNGYDAKVIQMLTEGLCDLSGITVADTCEMARAAFPSMPNHKLKTWGEMLGLPKMDSPSFDTFSPEMVPYCERDVRVTKMLFDFLMEI